MISYAPFWKTLQVKGISQYTLVHEYNFSNGTLDRLRKNSSITLNTLHDICIILDCDILDVVMFVDINPNRPLTGDDINLQAEIEKAKEQ